MALRGEGICKYCTAGIRGCVFEGGSGVGNGAISAVQVGVGRKEHSTSNLNSPVYLRLKDRIRQRIGS